MDGYSAGSIGGPYGIALDPSELSLNVTGNIGYRPLVLGKRYRLRPFARRSLGLLEPGSIGLLITTPLVAKGYRRSNSLLVRLDRSCAHTNERLPSAPLDCPLPLAMPAVRGNKLQQPAGSVI